MEKRKCILSIGTVDKYMIFILIGGISQCICSFMLYIFRDTANYNNHSLIIGFNAALGMSFSFIPFLIVKINSYKPKKKNKPVLVSVLSVKGPSNLRAMNDVEYLEKYNEKKIRTQKYLILFACAFLDFSQKSMTYIFNKYVINNIWIFNICFISLFEYCIIKRKLYKHQYFSGLIMIVLGIIATIIGLLGKDQILIKLLLCLTIEIQYSFEIALAKYLMDYRECSPFEITFYEGFFSLIVNSILLAIFTNYPLPDNDKYDDIFRITNHEGKKYLDHFYEAFKNMSVGEGLLFALSAVGRLISSISGHIVIKQYTAPHIALILVLGEIFLPLREFGDRHNIVQFILFCFVLVMSLIFTEIIEINTCDFEKNTRKNIFLRGKSESNVKVENNILANENLDDKKIELTENLEIVIEEDKSTYRTESEIFDLQN